LVSPERVRFLVVESGHEDRRWLKSQRAVGTVEIVGVAPVLVEDPGLEDRVEDLSGE
jgi:riboflavin biosynthesis pyrimidine reductase